MTDDGDDGAAIRRLKLNDIRDVIKEKTRRLSCQLLGRVLINRDCSAIAAANDVCVLLSDAQAVFLRRRHQPRRPPAAKIRPGRPAPATGPGTRHAAVVSPIWMHDPWAEPAAKFRSYCASTIMLEPTV